MSTNAALLFLKPHVADNQKVRELVRDELHKHNIKVIDVGEISSEKIAKEQLIDNHYYAIASKAVLLKPDQLPVPTDVFENKFHISWKEALKRGLCLNAMDAGEKWGLTPEALEKKWEQTKKRKQDFVKFGGGFYCAMMDGHYVFNGFFMKMRADYVAPGKMIYFLKVEWSPNDLSWKEFRLRLLGTTNPAKADNGSIRGRIYAEWKQLGLSAQPDGGNNGIHGSASAFEALIERMNWCGQKLEKDPFGKLMLDAGVTEDSIVRWTKDPQVVIDATRKMGGFFDEVEDMDSDPSVAAALRMQKLNESVDESGKWGLIPLVITVAFATIGAYMFSDQRKSKNKTAE